MITIQLTLKLLFITSALGMGWMMFLDKKAAYRVLAVIAVSAGTLGATLDYGVHGLLVILAVIGIVIPFIMFIIIKATLFFTWMNVRRTYPEQPKQPPCKPVTIGDVYKSMWLA